MTKILLSLAIGFCFGVVLHANYGTIVRETNFLIEVCEKELPRNKHCILTAIPKVGK